MKLTAGAAASVLAGCLLALGCSSEPSSRDRAGSSGQPGEGNVVSTSTVDSQGRSAAPEELLGMVWGPRITWGFRSGDLVRLKPRTLASIGARLSLRKYVSFTWSFSPDRSKLVFGGLVPSLGFVDLRGVRWLGDVKLGGKGTVIATAWPSLRRVLAVVQRPFSEGELQLILVDPIRREVLSRRRLTARSEVVDVATSSDGLALLTAPPDSVGPTRLILARADGSARSARIDAISGGTKVVRGADRSYAFERRWYPALAVDQAGRRAFVVGGAARVADVDLATMRVAYHSPAEPVSLLGRLREWLEPAALAKGESEGPVRTARWLSDGLLAVSGWDAHGTDSTRAAGLKVIDTRNWTVRTLDQKTGSFTVAGRILLAYGCCFAPGLTAYDLDGTRLWHRFGERTIANVEASDQLVYVYRYAGRRYWVEVLDLASGKTLRSVESAWFQLLGPEGATWPPH